MNITPKTKILYDIDQEIKRKESDYDKEVKNLKSNINLLKLELDAMNSTHVKNIKELKEKYENQISIKKQIFNENSKTLNETLLRSKETLLETEKELNKVDLVFSKVKLSCKEELQDLQNSKKILFDEFQNIDKQIKNINFSTLPSLKKQYSSVKSKQKLEKNDWIFRITQENQQKQLELDNKKELLKKLELCINELKQELSDLETSNKAKISNITSLIKQKAIVSEKVKFSMSKITTDEKDTKISVKLENLISIKTKELDQSRLENTLLKDRSINLYKFVYGKQKN